MYRENGVALTEVAPGSTKGWGLANQGHQKGDVALYPLLLIILVYACKRALEAKLCYQLQPHVVISLHCCN